MKTGLESKFYEIIDGAEGHPLAKAIERLIEATHRQLFGGPRGDLQTILNHGSDLFKCGAKWYLADIAGQINRRIEADDAKRFQAGQNVRTVKDIMSGNPKRPAKAERRAK